MIHRYRRKYKLISTCLLAAAFLVFNEFVVYYIKSFEWNLKDCSNCMKILIVADPQILGNVNENYFGSAITIWDNDRYLYKTFRTALKYTQPSVIIFLGDLMDEGHISDFNRFEHYKKRFDSIFETPDHIMKIYLPGDNDIGGEDDFVNKNIHERFKFTYTQPDVLIKDDVMFVKINKMTQFIPPLPEHQSITEDIENRTINIVLSHMPLLFRPDNFVQNVIKEVQPQIMFTAHEHNAVYISKDTILGIYSSITHIPTIKTPLYKINLIYGDVYEFLIPTCSYRMGTSNMGYGLAYIDSTEKIMDFTILWLPNRFFILTTYVIMIVFILIISCCKCT